MILLDGKKLSESLLLELKSKIIDLKKIINLDIILLGDNPSSQKYVCLKQKKASEVGIGGQLFHLPQNTSKKELLNLVSNLNQNPKTSSFFIQLPIPNITNPSDILNTILPKKDTDGLHPNSGINPAVVRGIITMLSKYQIPLENKNIVVINDSILIGQPLKKYFSKFTSQITLLNEQTLNLTPFTLAADILISATSVKSLISADMVKEGVIAIDVGGGDIDFENVSKKAAYITPTFGGVGPMTVASLLENTYDLAMRK